VNEESISVAADDYAAQRAASSTIHFEKQRLPKTHAAAIAYLAEDQGWLRGMRKIISVSTYAACSLWLAWRKLDKRHAERRGRDGTCTQA